MDRKTLINKIKIFRNKIKDKYNLSKIILFGSMANNNPHKDSDVDLIVVSKDFEGKKSFRRAPDLYIEWHSNSNINLPVDFLCYTPEEFNKLKKQVSIVKQALKEGIEIK